jgi:thiol-disulfide isomerase/thioredoxin
VRLLNEGVMRNFVAGVWCLSIALCLTTATGAFAQSGAERGSAPQVAPTPAAPVASPTSTPLSGDAASLYEDASKYVERKFAEFRQNRVPFSRALATETFGQQRELAARHAAQLAARGQLAGTDHYYLGMLYNLAGKSPETVDSLRRFLAQKATGAPAGAKALTKDQEQTARLILGTEVAALNRFEEAESVLAEYTRSEPATPQGLFKLHHALARAYSENKKIAESAAHARVAFKVAKESPVVAGEESDRAQIIGSAARFLADVLLQLKKEREAAATMEELLRLGLSLPSAQVFTSAARWLAEQEQEELIERVLREMPPETALPAPEIDIAEWIDHKPLKLADLRGRVVLLDFWATWCGPCRFTMPKLKTLHERFKKDGLVVVGLTQFFGRAGKNVVTQAEELAYLRDYKKDLKLPYAFAVALDESNDERYGVQSIPTAFLLDRRGRVRYISVGASSAQDEEFSDVIKRLLAEQP